MFWCYENGDGNLAVAMLASVTMCNDDISNYNSKINWLGPSYTILERIKTAKKRTRFFAVSTHSNLV